MLLREATNLMAVNGTSPTQTTIFGSGHGFVAGVPIETFGNNNITDTSNFGSLTAIGLQ